MSLPLFFQRVTTVRMGTTLASTSVPAASQPSCSLASPICWGASTRCDRSGSSGLEGEEILWKSWLTLASFLLLAGLLKPSAPEASSTDHVRSSRDVLECCPGIPPKCPPWCDASVSGN